MKEELEALLKEQGTALEAGDIAERLNVSLDDTASALKELVGEGRAVLTKKGRYAAPEALGLTAARAVVGRSGAVTARPIQEGEAMRVSPPARLRCFRDDLLLVRPKDRDRAGTRFCELVSIVARGHDTFSAVLADSSRPDPYAGLGARTKGRKKGARDGEEASARPFDSRMACDIRVTGELMGARDGDMVVLKVARWPEYDKPLVARALRVMGEGERLQIQLKAIAEDHGFATVFDPEIEDLAAAFRENALPGGQSGRRDLTDLMLFTIDGEDAKDFDDAVSLEPLPEGGWRLGVHIADVSYYVKPGEIIDREARKRGTSVYLPGLTLPMLPHALSDDLCSLKPDVDRLAMSLLMTVEDSRVTGHDLFPSVIHSKARLTYTAVNRLFLGEESGILPEARETLRHMLEVSHALRDARTRRGSIDFDVPETAFDLGPDGEPLDVHKRERGEAERMIEDFMLAANETVAELTRHAGLPMIYRVHEKPDPAKLSALAQFLGGLGIPVHLGADPHPGVLQRLLQKTENDKNADIIRYMTIRSLKRARYSAMPEGHYALAARDYCHFTSPIRRYPDLTVHRALKQLLVGVGTEKSPGSMAELAESCSVQEFAATSAEREADDLLKAVYMSRHIGETYNGVVSGVTAWGAYVTLPNTVEGLLHVATLNDYFEYDEKRGALVGAHTGKAIRLGDSLRVKVVRADAARREVDFEMA